MKDWLVYVIGYPGCGKTSAMKEALDICDVAKPQVESKPFAHTIYPSGIVELGRARDTYGGTDALSLNAQPTVVKWLKDVDIPVIVAEGDRLANRKFFNEACGYEPNFNRSYRRRLCLIHIKCPELTARRRAWERGSRFNESWLKGRISKVDTLVEAASNPFVEGSMGRPNEPGYECWKEPVDLSQKVFSFMAGEFHEIDGTKNKYFVGNELASIIGSLNG